MRKRPKGQEPECKLCPTAGRWTPGNRGIYRRWMLHRSGVDTGEIDKPTAWAFMRLAVEECEVNSMQRQNEVVRGIVRAFGG